MHTSSQAKRLLSLSLSAIILLGPAVPRSLATAPTAPPNAPPQAARETGRGFKLSSEAYSVTERAGSLKVTVERVGDVSGADSVAYATAKGTASDVSDFTRAAGRLHFAPGQAEKTFVVHVIRDARREATETVAIELKAPSAGARAPRRAPPRSPSSTTKRRPPRAATRTRRATRLTRRPSSSASTTSTSSTASPTPTASPSGRTTSRSAAPTRSAAR